MPEDNVGDNQQFIDICPTLFIPIRESQTFFGKSREAFRQEQVTEVDGEIQPHPDVICTGTKFYPST